MGKNANSTDHYWRAGIAMPLERKKVFEERLAALGLKTVGELANLFTLAPGTVEALKPIAAAWLAENDAKGAAKLRKEAQERMKNLTPAQLQALLAQIPAATAEGAQQ